MATDRTKVPGRSARAAAISVGVYLAVWSVALPGAAQQADVLDSPETILSPTPTERDGRPQGRRGSEPGGDVTAGTVQASSPAWPANPSFAAGRPWFAPTTRPLAPPYNPNLVPAAGRAPAFLVTPSIDIRESWTDNASLTEDGDSDFYTTVSAGLKVDGRTRRFDLGLDYNLAAEHYVFHPELDELRHTGIFVLNSELIDDTFFLDARASISEQALNPTDPQAADSRSSSQARTRVMTATVSPRLQHQFGSAVVGALSASHSETITSSVTNSETSEADERQADSLKGSVSDRAMLELRSGDMFTRFLWDYSSAVSYTLQRGGSGLLQQAHQFATEYRVNREVGLLAVAGYDLSSGQTLTEDIDGPFFSLGVHWTPSPDTDLRVGVGRRYNQTNVFALVDQKIGARTTLRLSRNTGVGTDATNTLDRLNTVQRDEQGKFVDPFSGLAASPSTQSFSLSNATYRLTTTQLSATHARARDAFTINGTLTERDVLGGNTDATTASTPGSSRTSLRTRFNWSHDLTRRLSSSAWISTDHVLDSSESNDESQSYSGGLRLNYQLGAGFSATAGYTYSLSISDETDGVAGGSSSERVAANTVFLGLRKTF